MNKYKITVKMENGASLKFETNAVNEECVRKKGHDGFHFSEEDVLSPSSEDKELGKWIGKQWT